MQALQALLVVAAPQEGAGAAVQNIVIPGAGVEAQIARLGLDHPADHLNAVRLGRLPAQGVDKGGIGGIGITEDRLHLGVEFVNIEAGDIRHHNGAYYGHQGGDQQEHDQYQLHVEAAEHGGSSPAARKRPCRPVYFGLPAGGAAAAYSMDFRDSAMSIRRSRGRMPAEIARVNRSVMAKEIP